MTFGRSSHDRPFTDEESAARLDQPYADARLDGFGGAPVAAPLLAGVVQRRALPGAEHEDPGAVHAAAAHGTSGAASALPHLDTIQRAFGHHDVGGIQAHVGAEATAGAGAMGAEAFATGHHVAFAGTPSLHTAAHEAAHVVQQQAGVHLKGGVGAEGDVHEQHADRVADGVVRGESVEGLLDEVAPAARSGAGAGAAVDGAIQRKKIFGWWALDKVKFGQLVGGARDTAELSDDALGKLIEFLENDSDGKKQIVVLKDLKAELQNRTSGDSTPKVTKPVTSNVRAPMVQRPTIGTPSLDEGGGKDTSKDVGTDTPKDVGTDTSTETVDSTPKETPKELVEPTTTTQQLDAPQETPKDTGPKDTGPKETGGGKPTGGDTRPEETVDTTVEAPKDTVEKPKVDTSSEVVATEGSLVVNGLPKVNEPEDGKPVFKSPPEYIPITFGGKALRVKAGQNYLNTELSGAYKLDADKIRGAEVTLHPAFIGSSNADDVRVIGDGHHRFVWAAFHGQSIPAKDASKRAIPNDWNTMKYAGTPEGMKLEPITEVESIKEDFFLAYVSPEPGFTKFSHKSVEEFCKAFAKYRKYLWDEDHGKQLVDHVQQRLDENPVRGFNEVVKSLAKKSKNTETRDGYEKYLTTVSGFFGGRRSPIVFGKTLTSGNFNSIYNVITLDPDMLPEAEQQLDTLTFETQNARQKSALTAAKQKTNSGEEIAAVEYVSDKKYVNEALMQIHGVSTLDALVEKLKIPPTMLVEVAFTEAEEKGGITLPPKSELPEQAARQALWWWKTKGWSDSQRKQMWGKAPHGHGVESSEKLYSH